MKIKAPFALKQVSVNIESGQAAGDHWLIAPFCMRRMRVLGQIRALFVWDYSIERAQLIGTLNEFAGRFTWRSL